MKVWVVFEDSVFQNYLYQTNKPNCPETFQTYLREIGTPEISFQQKASYVEVPAGSCIRLRSLESYEAVKQLHIEKPDKSRRTSSCTIV
jgi:hypothetical protein